MNASTLKQKLATKEYSMKKNTNSRTSSLAWEKMRLIYDANDKKIEGFVACIDCKTVVTYCKDGSTKNLNAHLKKCAINFPLGTSKQNLIRTN